MASRVHAILSFRATRRRPLERAFELFVTDYYKTKEVLALDSVPKELTFSPNEFAVAFSLSSSSRASETVAQLAALMGDLDAEYSQGDRPTSVGPPSAASTVRLLFKIAFDSDDMWDEGAAKLMVVAEDDETTLFFSSGIRNGEVQDERRSSTCADFSELRRLHPAAARAFLPIHSRECRAARTIRRWARMCLYDPRFKMGRRRALGLWEELAEGVCDNLRTVHASLERASQPLVTPSVDVAKPLHHVTMVFVSTDQRLLESWAGGFIDETRECGLYLSDSVLKHLKLSPGELTVACTVDCDGEGLGELWMRVMRGDHVEDAGFARRRITVTAVMRAFRDIFAFSPRTTYVWGRLAVITDAPGAEKRDFECSCTKLAGTYEGAFAVSPYPIDAFDDERS